MYYVLESKNIQLVAHLIYRADDGWGLSFQKGGEIPPLSKNSDLFVEVESRVIDIPDYTEVDGVPLVSAKFLEVLEKVGVKNYQSFPAEVRFKKTFIKDRFIINVVDMLECFDMEKSEYSTFGPCIVRMHSLQLKLKNDTPSMFRAEEYPCVIFISEKLKTEIERFQIEGCELRPADGWGDGHRF